MSITLTQYAENMVGWIISDHPELFDGSIHLYNPFVYYPIDPPEDYNHPNTFIKIDLI